jgi:hypothetical protein
MAICVATGCLSMSHSSIAASRFSLYRGSRLSTRPIAAFFTYVYHSPMSSCVGSWYTLSSYFNVERFSRTVRNAASAKSKSSRNVRSCASSSVFPNASLAS